MKVLKTLLALTLVAASWQASAVPGKKFCEEGSNCSIYVNSCGGKVGAKVHYGEGNRFASRDKRLSGAKPTALVESIRCSNKDFGDPAPGVHKACYLECLK